MNNELLELLEDLFVVKQKTYQDKINELVSVENDLRILKEKSEKLREELKAEILENNGEKLETLFHKIEIKQKHSYAWDDKILGFLRDRNVIEHFAVISDTKIKSLMKDNLIDMEIKLEIDRHKYIVDTKDILYLRSKQS